MAFYRLPSELMAMIASNLDDADITNFRLVCHRTNKVFLDDRSTVWPLLYNKKFDQPQALDFDELGVTFRYRSRVLNKGAARFFDGETNDEQICAQVLATLIRESYGEMPHQYFCANHRHSNNLETIEKFAIKHKLFEHYLSFPLLSKIHRTVPQENSKHYRLLAVQIALTHLRLKAEHGFQAVVDFPSCQKMVYEAPRDQPLFSISNPDINLLWIAHAINFFKHHLSMNPSSPVQRSFETIGKPHLRPHAWMKSLVHGPRVLGADWAGLYSSLEIEDLRSIRRESQLTYGSQGTLEDIIGIDDESNPFQDLDIDQPGLEFVQMWPGRFEQYLRSLTHPLIERLDRYRHTTTRIPEEGAADFSTFHSPTRKIDLIDVSRTHDGIRNGHFTGQGLDGDGVFAYTGWVTPWYPQSGVPGWQRFTMIKFAPHLDLDGEPDGDEPDADEEEDPQASPPSSARYLKNLARTVDADAIEEHDIWCYEGVVLPGGQIIVGRWWSPDDRDQSAGIGLTDPPAGPVPEIDSGPFIFWSIDEDYRV